MGRQDDLQYDALGTSYQVGRFPLQQVQQMISPVASCYVVSARVAPRPQQIVRIPIQFSGRARENQAQTPVGD